MSLAMIRKATCTAKPFLAYRTLEGFRSGVSVHVVIPVPLESEHFWTEIAFKSGWRMGFAVINKTV